MLEGFKPTGPELQRQSEMLAPFRLRYYRTFTTELNIGPA